MAEEAAAEAEATLEQEEVAATKIQALFRGIHDREKVKAMKQEQVRALYANRLFAMLSIKL